MVIIWIYNHLIWISWIAFVGNYDMEMETIWIPGLVNIQKTDGTDPPCYLWENPLFRLGHGLNSKLLT